MHKPKLKKLKSLLAFVLVLTTLLGTGGAVAVSAATDSDNTISNDRQTLEDIKEIANAISYARYSAMYEAVPKGDATIEVDVADFSATSDSFKLESYGDATALYTPGSGTVTWKVNVPERGKYTILIEYYPIASKTADIERMLKINNAIPFAEARYVSLPKFWTNTYQNAVIELENGQNAQTIVDEAEALGMTAKFYVKNNSKGKEVTCVEVGYPDVWTSGVSAFVEEYGFRFFSRDLDGNEIKPSSVSGAEVVWREFTIHDGNMIYTDPFEFVFEKGENTISLQSENEPMAIKSIKLVPAEKNISYSDYIAEYAGIADGKGQIKIEAEYMYGFSSSLLYPLEDRSSAINSPVSSNTSVLNTVGGTKWQTAGQWMHYNFSVDTAGLYNIYARYKQATSDGLFVSRSVAFYVLMTEADYIKLYGSNEGYAKGMYMTEEEYSKVYGDTLGYYNGVPFEEANSLRFNYSSDWFAEKLSDGSTEFKFYFEDGVNYVMQFDVTLGAMAEYINRVQEALDALNADYLKIVKLTGTSPDENIDYRFTSVLPDVTSDLAKQGKALEALAKEIAAVTGTKGSQTAILEKVAKTVLKMARDPERQIARNLETMKTEIGNLGTWLNNAKLQPLVFDYVTVQSSDVKAPKANANFFEALWYEIKSFFASFFRDYDRVGMLEDSSDDERIDVWLALGRDQSQILRELVNNDFTPNTKDSLGKNIGVNLRLVTESTLLPSVLSGSGPDVYIGLAQSNVINYAIRGALVQIDNMEGFYDIALNPETTQFNDAAMTVLGFEGRYYGLPFTMSFPMMFVRKDILGDYNIEIPETWEDLIDAGVELSGSNMEIGLLNDYRVFLYQYGGELFADDGMRINLDSNVALRSFEEMCNMFTEYKYSYEYNFANRFRTGEMPIGIQDYVSAYNNLKVFATEIEGKWGMYPVPGTPTGQFDENGNEIIDHSSIATVTATVIVAGCDSNEKAWEFLKWQTGSDCQSEFAEKMVSVLGDSGKQATANLDALASLTWSTSEYAEISYQVNHLASVPNYPGFYIIDRYTQFAFLDAYNSKLDPVTQLRSYIDTINKEITRKRKEFGLEVLEFDGKAVVSLAVKRRLQMVALLEEGEVLAQNRVYDGDDVSYVDVTYTLSDSARNKYKNEINGFIDKLKEDDIDNERLNSEILEDMYEILPIIKTMAEDTSLSEEDQKGCDALLEFIETVIASYEKYKLYE